MGIWIHPVCTVYLSADLSGILAAIAVNKGEEGAKVYSSITIVVAIGF